tara:strand:- start:1092 stop:1958 length:867 start_codon:yes stop_codon:yes gene_type:complete
MDNLTSVIKHKTPENTINNGVTLNMLQHDPKKCSATKMDPWCYLFNMNTFFGVKEASDCPQHIIDFLQITNKEEYAILNINSNIENCNSKNIFEAVKADSGSHICSLIDFYMRGFIGGAIYSQAAVFSIIIDYRFRSSLDSRTSSGFLSQKTKDKIKKEEEKLSEAHKDELKDTGQIDENEIAIFLNYRAKPINLLVINEKNKYKIFTNKNKEHNSYWVILYKVKCKNNGQYSFHIFTKKANDKFKIIFTPEQFVTFVLNSKGIIDPTNVTDAVHKITEHLKTHLSDA